MQPRYQIFVSSTFRDLREERQAALEAILELGHFPAGMEAFPAADATPWDLIRRIIEESDYYIVVVGGKYGSVGPAGISYTEMEFDLAVELRKPIMGFLHGALDEIPVGRSELDPETRQRLSAFRAKVAERLVKTWNTKQELKAAVLLAIVHAIRTKPALGWVRFEGPESQELLKDLVVLRKRYDKLEEENQSLRDLLAQDERRTADRVRSLARMFLHWRDVCAKSYSLRSRPTSSPIADPLNINLIEFNYAASEILKFGLLDAPSDLTFRSITRYREICSPLANFMSPNYLQPCLPDAELAAFDALIEELGDMGDQLLAEANRCP